MPTDEHWRALIGAAPTPQRVSAKTFVKSWTTFSLAAQMRCDDGVDYIVKGPRTDRPDVRRTLITEQVVGRVGRALGAPVPEVVLVEVVAELVAGQLELQTLEPGSCHGSRVIPDCSERQAVAPPSDATQRKRYGLMSMLYGVFVGGDHQVIVQNGSGEVYAHDHGLCLPGAQRWTVDTLRGAPDPKPDDMFARHLDADDLDLARSALDSVTDEVIAEAVAAPPSAWAITDDERVALAGYIAARRDKLRHP